MDRIRVFCLNYSKLLRNQPMAPPNSEIAGSSNGRTPRSGRGNSGSSPGPAAMDNNMDNKENWFKKHSVEIQAIATLALVAATGYYAYSTKEIVDITRNEFNISNRPYISVEDLNENYDKDDGDKLILSFGISNRGKIPARITNFNTKTGILTSNDNAEMILSPGETKYKNNVILKKPGIQNNPLEFQVQIIYYSLADKNQINKYCIEYYFSHDPSKKQIDYQKVISCE